MEHGLETVEHESEIDGYKFDADPHKEIEGVYEEKIIGRQLFEIYADSNEGISSYYLTEIENEETFLPYDLD